MCECVRPSDGRPVRPSVVFAQSASDELTLSGWGLIAVCKPIHFGGGDSRRALADRKILSVAESLLIQLKQIRQAKRNNL